MTDPPGMPEVLSRIVDALRVTGIPHVFVGALPVLAWGRPRGTSDFDLVIFCTQTGLQQLTQSSAPGEYGERKISPRPIRMTRCPT